MWQLNAQTNHRLRDFGPYAYQHHLHSQEPRSVDYLDQPLGDLGVDNRSRL